MNRARVLAVLGWGGLAAVVVGIALTVIRPHAWQFDQQVSAPPEGAIQLTKQKQPIVVPADKTYGIWAEDKNNSGYLMSRDCSIVDDRGRPIQLDLFEGPAVELEFGAGSPDADFVYEFNTGNGKLTVLKCKGSGAEFSVRPLVHSKPVDSFAATAAVRLTVGAQLIQFGVGMLIAWLVVHLVRTASPPAA